MHEHSFIEAILKPIKERNNVKSIELEVGELAPIEANHLTEHLKQHTGWEIKTIIKPSLIHCICNFKGQPLIKQRLHDLVIYECPKCHSQPLGILEGKGIKILRIIYNL